MEKITTDFRINTSLDYYENQVVEKVSAPHITNFISHNAKGNKLLDFGCGIGSFAYELKKRGFSVTGVDTNKKYIDKAVNAGVNAKLIQPEGLEFKSKEFDTTYIIDVLEHLSDQDIKKILPELIRVTKSRILITVPNNTQYLELIKHEFMFGHYHALDHVQFFTVENMRLLLTKYFKEVKIIEGDPLFPHRMLPWFFRIPIKIIYKLKIVKPKLFSRIYAVADIRKS